MLISTTAIVKWHPSNKKRYVELGYEFTKMRDEFEVKIEDLSKGSNSIVQWKCDFDGCDEIISGTYYEYNRCLKEDGKIYCKKCATKLFTTPKMVKTKLKKGKSFEDLCIELNRQDLLDRWDEEKNGCKPSEVSYSSSEPRWFKCDKYPDTHHSELKNLSNFVHGRDNTMNCKQCNSVGQDIIDNYGEEFLWKVWSDKNKVSPFEIALNSHTEVWWNCLNKDKNHKPYLRSCASSKKCKYRCPECYEHPKGENHPRYNPSIPQEERENGRCYPEYIQFTKDVMARDNYTCQVTGIISNGRNLEVHHINGFNWDKENRTNPNNGVVLCKSIHNLFHKLYGKGNNTEEQFEEFLMKIEYGEIDISNIK